MTRISSIYRPIRCFVGQCWCFVFFCYIQFAEDKNKKNSPEAIQKRLQRKAKRVGAAAVRHVKSHRRKESLAEKLLLGPALDDDDLDFASKDVE